MVRCPKCGAELSDEYGMVTCPSCTSILFIDFEGQAMLADAQADPVPDETGATVSPVALPEIEAEFVEQSMEPTSASGEVRGAPGEVPSEMSRSPELYQAVAELTAEVAPEPEVSQNETASSDDPLGLNAYANSEFSQAKHGPLVYTLSISGVDSKELRESLREAISDSRFAWDSERIMKSIRQGVVRIENISPVKASILVNRLKRLPVQIRWEQNVVTTVDKF